MAKGSNDSMKWRERTLRRLVCGIWLCDILFCSILIVLALTGRKEALGAIPRLVLIAVAGFGILRRTSWGYISLFLFWAGTSILALALIFSSSGWWLILAGLILIFYGAGTVAVLYLYISHSCTDPASDNEGS